MSFQPPTTGKLLAMAGWAVSCLPEASPQQQSALLKFRDGCAELAECRPPELLVVRREPAASLPLAGPKTTILREAAIALRSSTRAAAIFARTRSCLELPVGPRFRTYVEERHIRSYDFDGPVRVGAVLPAEGVTYYDVPPEYGVREYRYTVVDDEPVLVDPYSHLIVEIVR